MSVGLRIWNSTGNVILNITDRTLPIYAIYNISIVGGNAATWTQTINVAGSSTFLDRQVLLALINVVDGSNVFSEYGESLVMTPLFSWSGDNLSIVFNSQIYSGTATYTYELLVCRG